MHVAAGPGRANLVVLRDSKHGLTLHCGDGQVARSPVDVTLQFDGVPNAADVVQSVVIFEHLMRRPEDTVDRSLWRILRRDALACLDGKALGASYQDIAKVLYPDLMRGARWTRDGNSLKEHLRRAYAVGQDLRDGGYLDLLEA